MRVAVGAIQGAVARGDQDGVRSALKLADLALGERFSVTRDDECVLTTHSGRWTMRHLNGSF